jgi:hypothetical protein
VVWCCSQRIIIRCEVVFRWQVLIIWCLDVSSRNNASGSCTNSSISGALKGVDCARGKNAHCVAHKIIPWSSTCVCLLHRTVVKCTLFKDFWIAGKIQDQLRDFRNSDRQLKRSIIGYNKEQHDYRKCLIMSVTSYFIVRVFVFYLTFSNPHYCTVFC